MSDIFKEGDVVMLKASTVRMVVRYTSEGKRTRDSESEILGVVCEWMDLNNHIQQYEFKPTSLEHVPNIQTVIG